MLKSSLRKSRLPMECPHCHSSDVIRSRRKFAERFLLPVFRASVMRCRDCKKRFWIGVEWGSVILGLLTMTVTACLLVGVVLAHQASVEKAAAKPVVAAARRYRRAMPKLPPLSSIHRAADDPVLADPLPSERAASQK